MAKASKKVRSVKNPVPPVLLHGCDGELVLAGMLARCFKVTAMSISRWRQSFGLPHLRVSTDMLGEGSVYAYDLDQAEKWAKATGRPFRRELAFRVRLPKRFKTVRRIPREDRDSA